MLQSLKCSRALLAPTALRRITAFASSPHRGASAPQRLLVRAMASNEEAIAKKASESGCAAGREGQFHLLTQCCKLIYLITPL